jgi:hypothetical protein
MRRIAFLFFTMIALALSAAEAPIDVDPNTKTEGGADLRGSGANAGSGARTDDKIDDGARVMRPEPPRPAERGDIAGPDAAAAQKEKPISARKPRETELEEASKGATKPQQ